MDQYNTRNCECGHEIGSSEPDLYGPIGWVITCTCSNPEGDYSEGFTGVVQFSGANESDAYDQWLDHHNEKVSE